MSKGRKLMQMLGLAVNSLDRMEQLLPVVQSLSTRHVSCGVRDKDYDTVGQALSVDAAERLGEAFTPDVEAAWSDVYARSHPQCKVGRERRLEPLLFSPSRYNSCRKLTHRG